MKLRYSRNPLPRHIEDSRHFKGIVDAWDICVRVHGRLFLKVVVFESEKAMRIFWNKAVSPDSGWTKGTSGVVSELSMDVVKFTKAGEVHMKEVDPRYFAIMGLIRGRTDDEVLAHESVHAGFAYARRLGKRSRFYEKHGLDDEMVCYPAGRISAALRLCIPREGK